MKQKYLIWFPKTLITWFFFCDLFFFKRTQGVRNFNIYIYQRCLIYFGTTRFEDDGNWAFWFWQLQAGIYAALFLHHTILYKKHPQDHVLSPPCINEKNFFITLYIRNAKVMICVLCHCQAVFTLLIPILNTRDSVRETPQQRKLLFIIFFALADPL